ncbi:dihydrofolate reductase family protein [Actinokineospora globicatena]|uniref:Deaminase reductase n=1 Tax=Actinokineospora globicatena TaxID=103729 RepID=A0A9W6QKR9_9PSEU|nr:dihydrofolate reductase family protein [Actinokineospora globicatena]GLW90382.1 deaminase reductase [Actinokineospora globicatena]
MKLTVTMQISVDGVMQANGGRNEELDPGFERGGWARPLFGGESAKFVGDLIQRADAFLLGRRTYELFAGYWGTMPPGSGPIADALNERPKYAASNTLTESLWADTTILSGDLESAIRALRANGTGELQVHGSGVLVRWLLERDLIDEMTLLVVPVVVGEGTRLFPASGRDIALDLVDTRVFPNGIVAHVYRPNGRPRYATPE